MGLGYLVIGLAWIGFSDEAGGVLFSSAEAITHFQTYKGAAFIAATAVFVFVLAARGSRAAAPAVDDRLPVGLGVLLAVLVLVTAAPLVALLGYNIVRATRVSIEDGKAVARDVAAATAAEAAGLLAQRQRIAQVLARPMDDGMDSGERCSLLLVQVPMLHEDVRNAFVLDREGRPLCAARSGSPLPVRAAALRGRRHALLQPVGTGDESLALTWPVLDAAGGVEGSVQLLLRADLLAHLVAVDAPEGATNALLTLDGVLLAREPALPGTVGRRLPALTSLIDRVRRGQDSAVAVGLDGVERFYALRPIGEWDLAVATGVEIGSAFDKARSEALRSLGTAAAVLMLAGLLISGIVRRIAGPMRRLAEAADSVAAGHFDHRAPEAGPHEVAAVATQFNRMLDRLPALERALRESEERHRTLVEKLSRNVPGMIFQLCMKASGCAYFPFVSEGVAAMFETTPAAAGQDAKAILDRIHPEDAAEVHAQLLASAATLAHLRVECRVLLADGRLRHYLTFAQPERSEGSVLWHGCTVDVTQLKQAEAALREANELLEVRVTERTQELAAANESLESFSYSIAHDLRAPLQAVEGFTEALPAVVAKGDAPRLQRLVDRIGANTVQMGRMIDGLLAVAKAGKGRLEERTVDQEELVADVLSQLPIAPGTQVQQLELPRVRADAGAWRQVWWNLLSNAVKFTAGREPARIRIGWERREGELVFWIGDNGAGFEPQFAGRLFNAFQRLHDAHAFEGSGIGLALARRIVERHGGRMWAEGAPEQGACFYFTLPATRAA